jgi:hypothetical protein
MIWAAPRRPCCSAPSPAADARPATARVLAGTPHVAALHAAVARRPRVAAYLASERREPFNEHGIFRRYPELDG